ncbi:Erg28-like protein [Ramaria rubella]|nr:Erg28-like protein [Ramaria rubella]
MSFLSFLPTTPGLLPKWQLLVSGMAFFNSAQNLLTLKLTRRIYTNTSVTAVQARTFAIWTFFSAIVRLYCAYNIHEKAVYDITLWSYVSAFLHFTSEWLLFRSANLSSGLLGPLIVAPVSFFWMIQQYDHYVVVK